MSQFAAPHLSPALQVAIVGPGASVTEDLAGLAREVGSRLADAGCVVVTGGGDGVMAAAAEGVNVRGGVVTGLLPGSDRAAAVGPLTVAIATGLGELRNGVIVRTADVVITIGGSWGTASEIAVRMARFSTG